MRDRLCTVNIIYVLKRERPSCVLVKRINELKRERVGCVLFWHVYSNERWIVYYLQKLCTQKKDSVLFREIGLKKVYISCFISNSEVIKSTNFKAALIAYARRA